MIHIIMTANGPVTPVGIEQAVESVAGVDPRRRGRGGADRTQQVVLVVAPTEPPRRPDLAPGALAASESAPSRASTSRRSSSFRALPVDKRHNSKIDRTRVGEVGGRGARRRTDTQTVKVLVTGANELARRRGCGTTASPWRRRDGVPAPTERIGRSRGARRRRRSASGRCRGRRGRGGDPRRGPGDGRRTMVGIRGNQHHRYRERARRGSHRGRQSVRVRLVALGGQRRQRRWSARPRGPADPDLARGNYSRSKAAAERLALDADTGGFSVVAVRPHLVWGPGDTQLIGRIVSRARQGRLAVIGSGAALIDTTYIDNAADAIVAASDRAGELGGRALVVSNGQPRPVRELLNRIASAAGLEPPRLRVPRGGGPRAPEPSSSDRGIAFIVKTTRRSPDSSPSSCRPRIGSTSAKPAGRSGGNPRWTSTRASPAWSHGCGPRG